MADLGWFNGQRVELIDREVVQRPRQKNWHVVAIQLTHDALQAAFGPEYWVRNQGPLHLGDESAPAPDLAVIHGRPREFSGHPTTALPVVEVSDTTLAYDRGHKASLYAREGIADYWIVNLVERRLEVLRRPVADAERPLGFAFVEVTSYSPGDVVSPLAAPQARVRVADLLP
jgi:Uma2 family endonuclease